MHSVHLLLPAQRYVFSLDGESAVPERLKSSADGFRRYKELQEEGKTVGMVAFPNSVLVRASEDYLVDPGLIMQVATVLGALAALRASANDVNKAIMTHLH